MSEYKYNFTLDQFPNNKYDTSKLDREIRDSSITVSLAHLEGAPEYVDVVFRNPLIHKDLTTLSGVVASHDGIDDYIEYNPVKIVATDESATINTSVLGPHDRSGKLRVHQTSRKLGTVICWTGEGDDPTKPSVIGGGESFSFSYTAGQADPLVRYIDFNIVENETWLHEGYVTWNNCDLDTLDLMMVTRSTQFEEQSGSNYNIYGGYLIIPAVPGTGTINVTSDITQHDGGLVYMPDNDLGEKQTAFWDAEWDTVNKKYKNISPNLEGKGEYNLFTTEITLAHFVRKMSLLNSGFIPLNSSDTDQLGHGMRLKMIADTNKDGLMGDHDWSIACTMCLHRAKTV